MGFERFDRRYFERFYFSRRTRVAAPLDYLHRARLLGAYSELFGLRVGRILDAGAGAGFFLRALDAVFPGARTVGIDVSPYACATYGWQQTSLEAYVPTRAFDVVVCCDVLQYLSRPAAASALLKLADLCHGLLYFSVLTREDWNEHCDQSRTDGEVHLRSARWYRERLRPAFRHIGTGIYLARTAPPVLFALDARD